MEVLVTGSSGFIGKNLLERLSRIENVKIHTFDIEYSFNKFSPSNLLLP